MLFLYFEFKTSYFIYKKYPTNLKIGSGKIIHRFINKDIFFSIGKDV
jgi:hypothetical protein